MTANKGIKRHVRDRAARTGESYTTALAHVRRGQASQRSASDARATTNGPLLVVSGPSGVGKSTVSRLVAAAFDRSVHLQTDDFMASVVSGWVDPNLPEAEHQNLAVGGALAVAAMGFAADGYTTVVDGHLFPDGVAGLATVCSARGLVCHYLVLTADLDVCWQRAVGRGEGRWRLEREPFAALHARFARLELDPSVLIDASGPVDAIAAAVLTAFQDGRLAVSA